MAIIFASRWTWSNDSPDYPNIHHSIKNVRIWSYSGTHFPAFGLDTERYSVSLRIQSECGKMWTRINPNTDTFHAVSSNENEVIRAILNLFTIFLRKDFVRTKSTKTKTSKNTKHKYANKNRKCLKTSKRKKVTHSLMCVFALATKKKQKSLYNGKVLKIPMSLQLGSCKYR